MAKQLEKNNVSVDFNLPKNLPEIYAVGNQIQQVLINLILNSVDANPDGGQVTISGAAVNDGVELFVKDNGPGIPEDRMAHIFEPFYSTKEGGTGLGLTVSYNIITAHGGSLEIISSDENGTCFRIYLPIGEEKWNQFGYGWS